MLHDEYTHTTQPERSPLENSLLHVISLLLLTGSVERDRQTPVTLAWLRYQLADISSSSLQGDPPDWSPGKSASSGSFSARLPKPLTVCVWIGFGLYLIT